MKKVHRSKEGRSRKRNLRSWYYDRVGKRIASASQMPSWPYLRPNRYIFLGQFTWHKKEAALWEILKRDFNIRKPKVLTEDLPF